MLQELYTEAETLEASLDKVYWKCLMNGEGDHLGCLIQINAGSGGEDSCDWTAMLARMYQRWASSKHYQGKLFAF
jgi:peptide chain release factor 2